MKFRLKRTLVATLVLFVLGQIYLSVKDPSVSSLIFAKTAERTAETLTTTLRYATGNYVNNSILKSSVQESDFSFNFTAKNSNDSSFRFAKRKTINYEQFNITEPNFGNSDLRDLFRKDPTNVAMYGVPTPEKLIGEVYVVRDGTFAMPYDCGYRSSVDFVTKKRDVPRNRWYRALVPLIIPDGWTFQHFMDGTLPKVIQALSYLQNPQVKLLMKTPRDKILWEILEKLNISRSNIILYGAGNYGADYLIFTCNTPPLHPVLWQTARRLLGSPDKLQVGWKEAYVVVVTRTGCFNCGRQFTNFDAFVETLRTKFGNTTVKLFKGPYSLQDTIELFGKAKLVVGAHGGGMVNVVFTPSDAHVIEMMPTEKTGARYIRGADKMIWIQSVLMGQTFWRLPLEPLNARGDMNVDLTLLGQILDNIPS